tara:strand:+ start:3124 stop:4236 length:1113 start_codon:yes stop_codon:yes gene_type:complete
MALIKADRIQQTSTTTGSADFTLSGHLAGFRSFSAGIGSSNTCYYGATDGSAFEIGLGTLNTAGNILARTTVFDSSHTSASTVHKVDFVAGSKDVFVTYAADKAVQLDADGNLSLDATANISTLGAVSVGGTLGVTSNASVTGTFTFATANSTGNLGVVKNASVGGTFTIDNDLKNTSGNLTVDPATQIFEIKGDGASVEGQFQLNCHANSHGQRVRAQPHSEGVTNTMFLPKGASSTLVSQVGTATLTNKTYFDTSGGLRQVPQSRSFASALTTASTTDIGNFIFCAGTASSTQTLVIPDGTFTAGDIFSVVNNAKTAESATTTFSAGQVSAVIAGAASATTLITLGVNGVASVLFTNASACVITGNVS